MEQPPLNDDAAANAGAQGDEDHIFAALAAALPVFAHGGYVGIVAGLDGQTCEGPQLVADVEYPPAQVDAAVYHAAGVYGPGNANAQAQQGSVGDGVGTPIFVDRGRDIRQDLFAALCRHRGDLPGVQHGAVFVKVCDFHSGAAQVYAKAVFHRGYLPYKF